MTVDNLHNGEHQLAEDNGNKEKIYTIVTKDENGRKQEVVIQREGADKRGGLVLDVHPVPKKSK